MKRAILLPAVPKAGPNGLLLLVLSVCMWTAFSAALAQDNPATRLSLKGLGSVGVTVQPIDPAAQKDGLSQQVVRRSVEQRLRRAGIPLQARADQPSGLRRPTLSVHVTTARLDTDEYIYSVRVELVQWVASLDDPTLLVTAAIPVPAATWSPASVLGITPADRVRPDVEDAILEMVEQFAEAYQRANPRETALGSQR